MEDTILTLSQLGKLFYDVTVAMIDSTPTADVRLTWATGGAPAFGINDNVVFISIYDVDSVMTKQREDIYSQIESPPTPNMATGYTRTLEVHWVFYGSKAWDWATLVRNRIYYQEFRETLSLQDIYPIPGFAPAKRVPELWQGLWYERMDLTVQFNELIIINQEIPYIESVEIGLYDGSGKGPEEDGLREDFIVTETDITIVEEH